MPTISGQGASDGYTLLHAAAPIAIGEALYKDLPYDVHKSFTSIASTAIAPLLLVVDAEAPYKSLAEFIKYAKADSRGDLRLARAPAPRRT